MKKKTYIKMFCLGAVFLLMIINTTTISAFTTQKDSNSFMSRIRDMASPIHDLILGDDIGSATITYYNNEGELTTVTINIENPDELASYLLFLESIGYDIIQVDIFDHGSAGSQQIGEVHISEISDAWEIICDILGPSGIVVFHGCEVASIIENMDGLEYLQNLANGGVTVMGNTGASYYNPFTGNFVAFNDWVTVFPEEINGMSWLTYQRLLALGLIIE